MSKQLKNITMASCNNVFAEPMLDDQNFLGKYKKQLLALKYAGHLPSEFKKKMTYEVYSLEGSGCGSHRSIVLSSDDKRFFSMELGFRKFHGIRRIYPVTRKIDASLKPKFTSHGTVKMSTRKLLARGVATMKKFGNYFKFGHNCQDFCNYYLEAIGLGETKKITDSDRATLFTAVTAPLAVLAAGLFMLVR